MANNRLAGVAYLTISGSTYQIAGSPIWETSGVSRTTVKGNSGVDGFKEMPKQGRIGAKIRDAQGLSVASINAMTSEDVVMQLANGKVISGSGMWSTGDTMEIDADEGTFDVMFEGRDVREN